MAMQADGGGPTFNFGAGMPDPVTFPSKELAAAAARVIEREGTTLVRYPGNWGYPGLREIARQRFQRNHGVDVPLDDIVLGCGSMQAINLLASAWAQPGTPVVVEEFTYAGTLGVFRHHQVDLVPVPLDSQGMRVDALDDTLGRMRQRLRPRIRHGNAVQRRHCDRSVVDKPINHHFLRIGVNSRIVRRHLRQLIRELLRLRKIIGRRVDPNRVDFHN